MKTLTLLLISAVLCFGQTLSLSGSATLRPGTTNAVDVVLAAPSPSTAALQWDLVLPPGFSVSATVTLGAGSTSAAKTLECSANGLRCITYGINTNVYAAGVVAQYRITVPPTQAPGMVPLSLSGIVAAKLDGQSAPLMAGPAYQPNILANTDLNGDGKTDVLDLQILIPVILGPVAANCPVPQNPDAVCNVLDLQIVARAAVGG